MKVFALITGVFSALLFSGCAIKVYNIDRQTVLEEEAAGQWPEFERSLMQNTLTMQPVPLPVVRDSERRKRLFRVLNGDLTSQVVR